MQVPQDDGTLVSKERGITLRMLLTHTCTSFLSTNPVVISQG